MPASSVDKFRTQYTLEQQAWMIYETNYAQDNNDLLNKFNIQFGMETTLKSLETFLHHANDNDGAIFKRLIKDAENWAGVWHKWRVELAEIKFPPTQVLSTRTWPVPHRAYVMLCSFRGHTLPQLTALYNQRFATSPRTLSQVKSHLSIIKKNKTLTKELISFGELFPFADDIPTLNSSVNHRTNNMSARDIARQRQARGLSGTQPQREPGIVPQVSDLESPGRTESQVQPGDLHSVSVLSPESTARIHNWIPQPPSVQKSTVPPFLGLDEKAYLVHFANYVVDFQDLLRRLNRCFRRNRAGGLIVSFFAEIDNNVAVFSDFYDIAEKFDTTWYEPHIEPPTAPNMILGSWEWRVELRAFLATYAPYCKDAADCVRVFREEFPREFRSGPQIINETLRIRKNHRLVYGLVNFAVRYNWHTRLTKPRRPAITGSDPAPPPLFPARVSGVSSRTGTSDRVNMTRFLREGWSEPPENKQAGSPEKAVGSWALPPIRQQSEPL